MSETTQNWDDIAAVLDQGWICHLGVSDANGTPTSLPMLYVRDGSSLVLHGGIANTTLQAATQRARVFGNVTLVDGLVVARSAFHSSVAYRSVTVGGTLSLIDDSDKSEALERVTEGLLPGRLEEIRSMTSGEVRGTVVLRLNIKEAVLRHSPSEVHDSPSDQSGPGWAGVIPIRVAAETPIPAADVASGTPLPQSVQRWSPPRG